MCNNFLFSFSMSVDKVQENLVGNGVKEQLRILCNIYALNLLHKHIGDSLAGYITPKQGALASEQLRSLYSMVLTINFNLSGETGRGRREAFGWVYFQIRHQISACRNKHLYH